MGLITFMSYQMMQGMFPNESEHYNVSRDTSSYHRADSNMHLKKKKTSTEEEEIVKLVAAKAEKVTCEANPAPVYSASLPVMF